MQPPQFEIPELKELSQQLDLFYRNDPTNSMVFHELANIYGQLPKKKYGMPIETSLDRVIGQYLLVALVRSLEAVPEDSSDEEKAQAIAYALFQIKNVVGPTYILKFLAFGKTEVEANNEISPATKILFLESINELRQGLQYRFIMNAYLDTNSFTAALEFFANEYRTKMATEPTTNWEGLFGWIVMEILYKYISSEVGFSEATTSSDFQIFINSFLRFSEKCEGFTNEEILILVQDYLMHYFTNRNSSQSSDDVLANCLIAISSLLAELPEGKRERIEQ